MRRTDLVRRAARWHALRPSVEGLHDLAELLLRADRAGALLGRVVHQLGAWSRYATPATATVNMVRDHNDRVARGSSSLPALRDKALGFQRCWSNRRSWAWLACR